MRPFAYLRPESLADAVGVLQEDTGARVLAGGTDLLTLMKGGLTAPDRLVDIKRLPDLDDTIEPLAGGGVRIGALATLAQIERHPLLQGEYRALVQAAALAATPQLRNMATIGGNLLQRPRCWYFRNRHVHCWLKGGDTCFAREGENQFHALVDESPCVAVHPSDPATALMALDARVTVRGPAGERTLTLDELFRLPTADRRVETTLDPGEVITAVSLPPAGDSRSAYLKAMDRKTWAFALVGAGVRLHVERGRIEAARLVLGGVAPVPWRAQAAEDRLTGAESGEDLFAEVADAALAGMQPLEHNGYKLPLLRTLIRRALADAASPS